MTLEEAIKHAEEKAKCGGQCGEDHIQLAEWLKELQKLRTVKTEKRNGKSAQNVSKEDLISRKAAIDALDSINCCGYVEEPWDIVRGIIERVPAAEPEKHTEERTETHACDCISRQLTLDVMNGRFETLKQAWGNEIKKDGVAVYLDMRGIIEALPSEQPRWKKGKWIERNPQNSNRCKLIECDQCGFFHIVGFNVPYEYWIGNRNFCERCGAYMGGEQDETD